MNAQIAEKDQRRLFAKVGLPDANGCMKWLGGLSSHGYGRFWLHGHHVRTHRVMYEVMLGPIPDGLEVDHHCGTRACVAPNHLRVATRKQNAENRGGATRHSTSGVRGVSPYRGRWQAQVGHNGRRIWLGMFDRIEDAQAAAEAARAELFTHDDRDRVAS